MSAISEHKVISLVSALSILTTTLSGFFVWASNRWIEGVDSRVKQVEIAVIQNDKEIAVSKVNQVDVLRRLERIDNKLDIIINKYRE